MSLEFILIQKAKSKGGDKYICTDTDTPFTDTPFTIYIPQTISRSGLSSGLPSTKMSINISQTMKNGLVFMLTQKAKAKGGDKYTCIEDPSFTIYVPQSLSRKDDQANLKLYIEIIKDSSLTLSADEDRQ